MMLKKGHLIFYPAASFSEKRAQHRYYMENVFKTGEYVITANIIADIYDYQVKTLGLTWLPELGSSKVARANRLHIKPHSVPLTDIEILRKMINSCCRKNKK